jgi:hypothetical protein
MTRWLLVVLVLLAAFYATPKAHALYLRSLSLSDLAARYDGERRTVKVANGSTVDVVVHRKEKWCQCPGLGVIAQAPSADPDSLFQLTDALFRAFQNEAARENGTRRCLTVTLELGDGMRSPWAERHGLSASLWRRNSDQKWVGFSSRWDTPVKTRRLLREAWPQTGTL